MKTGFIGCGNMAKAMIGGILNRKLCGPKELCATALTDASRKKSSSELGIRVISDNREAAQWADAIVLAVKPQYYPEVIGEIRDVVQDKLVISIAPGKSLAWLKEQFGKDVKLVRCMPNTPALVGEGMTGVCASASVDEWELESALSILNSFGRTEVVPEHVMDAVVGVSGSAPAYVFLMIEAMADAAVAEGMARNLAYEFAAQAVYGSAKMVLETGKHPGELKDMVCSPAGTTIQAVRVLEQKGFRSAMMEAIAACAEKSRSM